jgi:hypothetical protein
LVSRLASNVMGYLTNPAASGADGATSTAAAPPRALRSLGPIIPEDEKRSRRKPT